MYSIPLGGACAGVISPYYVRVPVSVSSPACADADAWLVIPSWECLVGDIADAWLVISPQQRWLACVMTCRVGVGSYWGRDCVVVL